MLEYCVWLSFNGSAQVVHVTTPCSVDIYRCTCISALSHNLLCPTAYFIWTLKYKLKLGTHSSRGSLTELFTPFVYEVFPCGDNITKYQHYFQICTSSAPTRKHIFTRYLLCFNSDGLFFGNTRLKQYLQLSTLTKNMGVGLVGRWAGRLTGRWAGGQVGRWAGGLAGRWAG